MTRHPLRPVDAGIGPILLSLALTLGLTPPVAHSALHEVPSEFPTVGAALASCAVGDTVQVAAGIYAPSTNGESFPLTLGIDGVVLKGAGMGLSILDAEGGAGVLVLDAATGRVTGFTVTGGRADTGGGFEILSGGVEVDANYILENGALRRGSGINLANSASPWIHHNVIWLSYDTDLEHFGDPHGVQYGDFSTGVFEHNLVGRGDSNGLFYLESASPTIRHNIFYENGIPELRGRGICAFGDDNAVIAHNLFHGNQIAALIVDGVGDVSAEDANAISGLDGIYGNLDGDPLLTDPENELYTLQWPSPAIDAGDPMLPGDPDGTVADLGPFPYDQSLTDAPVPRSGGLSVLPNVPNPFNPSTTLRFQLERPSSVRIELIDARGRRLRVIHEGLFEAGAQQLRFDGRDDSGRELPSGVYLVSFLVEGGRSTQPVVLLR